LGRLYNLPTFGLAGGSDSKLPDGQAVLEMSLSLTFEILSGNSLVHSVGALEGGKSACIELLAVGDEIISWLRAASIGLEISRETLAFDVIREVGLHNLYMSTEHSARHCRDDWQPTLLDSRRYEDWAQGGGLDLLDRARLRVADILKNAPPARPLPPRVLAKMDEIVADADAQA
jgi:trimethylamine--corrinoid protein Co-methyltransferase